MLEPTDVRTTLDRALDAIVAQAIVQAIALPTRQYVTVGGSVHDCEQVVCSALRVAMGLTGALVELPGAEMAPPSAPPVWQMALEMSIVRTANERVSTNSLPPPVAEIEADTDAMSRDTALLLAALQSLAGFEGEQVGAPQVELLYSQPSGGLVAVTATSVVDIF